MGRLITLLAALVLPAAATLLFWRLRGATPGKMLVSARIVDAKTFGRPSLLRLVALLNEQQVGLTSLETEEPNLERVFLHLTGRELRD